MEHRQLEGFDFCSGAALDACVALHGHHSDVVVGQPVVVNPG